jgi:hypothetical protein
MVLRVLLSLVLILVCSCGQEDAETESFIYVASGTAYTGNGVTAATPSQTVAKFNSDGTFNSVIRDYTLDPNNSPVALANYDSDNLLVLVQNASGRRVELVSKNGTTNTTFISNGTALVGTLRGLFATPDGGWLVSRNTAIAIEKFNSSLSRVTVAGNSFVSTAPATNCLAAASTIPKMTIGPSENIFFIRADGAANGQRISIVSSTGLAVVGDCLAAYLVPTGVNNTAYYGTSLLYHSTGKLLVSFSNNTGAIHQIYSYTVTANSVAAPILAYNNVSILQGITSMREMPDGTVLVSSGATGFNTIERFTFDSSAGTLSRIGSTSFMGQSVFTKSISDFIIAD